jgi:ankyrin repeat protein
MAAQKGFPNVLKALLLSTKVAINATTKNGVTVLILTAHKSRIEIVKALLEAKANVNVTISMKGKTYTLLSIIPERHKETISLLKEYGAK